MMEAFDQDACRCLCGAGILAAAVDAGETLAPKNPNRGAVVVNSLGCKPQDHEQRINRTPEGWQCVSTCSGTAAPPGLFSNCASHLGLTPQAIDWRPSGAARFVLGRASTCFQQRYFFV